MKESRIQYGLGFFDVLALIFIALKLTCVIDWRWLWVLAPAWGQLVLVLTIVSIGLLVMKLKDRI